MVEAIGLKVNHPKFWDPEHLRQEAERVFDICWSCRLCFKFCGSFPTLFELIDGKTERLRTDHLAAHPEIGAIVLECTNMPPYATAVRQAFELPVYDIYSFVTWFHAGLSPRDFGHPASANSPWRER